MLSIQCVCSYRNRLLELKHFRTLVASKEDFSKRINCSNSPQVRFYAWGSFARAVSESQPVAYAQNLLETLHTLSGFTWCSTIIATTLGLRLLTTLPLSFYQQYVIARFANLKPEIAELSKELAKETAAASRMYKLSEKQAKKLYKVNLKRHIKKLIIRDNCHPFKSAIVVLVQLPLWISLSFALRNMAFMMPYQDAAAQITFLELSVGGMLWFTNLTVPDPYFLLPVMFGCVNLLNIEMNALKKLGKNSKLQRYVLNILRGATIFMVPIAAAMPSCVTVYWFCSSLAALGQNVVIQLPKMRRMCRIPKTEFESATPFKDLQNNLKLMLRKN